MSLSKQLLEGRIVHAQLPELDEGRIEAVYREIQPDRMSLDIFRSNLSGEEITPEELEDLAFMRERIETWDSLGWEVDGRGRALKEGTDSFTMDRTPEPVGEIRVDDLLASGYRRVPAFYNGEHLLVAIDRRPDKLTILK